MNEPELPAHTRLDIDRRVHRVLNEAGFLEPPVDVTVVLQALELDREFYDLEDPGLLRRLQHRVLVGAQRLADFVEKVQLKALLLFDEKRVLLDKTLPAVKHPWASAHEAGHQIIPWHREFCRGDTLLTLDPSWHETLEAEANFAASALLFCGERFTADARDSMPCFDSVSLLRQRYRQSLLATARRYVSHGPDSPMILMVSTPPWEQKPPDQVGLIRYFMMSPAFDIRFPLIDADSLRRIVDGRAQRRSGGPVGSFEVSMYDRNSEVHVFRGEIFYNKYYLITLLVYARRAADTVLYSTNQTASA